MSLNIIKLENNQKKFYESSKINDISCETIQQEGQFKFQITSIQNRIHFLFFIPFFPFLSSSSQQKYKNNFQFNLIRTYMSITPVPTSHRNSLIQDFFSGGIAGIISKTVVAPVQRVKLLMQTQVENTKLIKKYTGVTECLTRCVKQEGFISLWRGNWVNVVRYFPTQALSFSFKDFFNGFFNFKSQSNEDKVYYLIIKIMNGGFAGSLTTLFVHPLDFARTRIGVDLGKSLAQRQFTGLSDCLKKTWRSDGIVGLYRGIVIAIPSIFIYRGLYFGIYDTGRDIILEKDASILRKFLLAQAAVILSEWVSYPGDTIKRKIMMQSLKKQKQYTGIVDCFQKTYKNEGLAGLWKGAYSNILRSIGSSLCLILYDQFRKVSVGKNE